MSPILLAQGAAAAGQVLNTISQIHTRLKQAEGNTSLIDITGVARVEPIAVVSQDCVNLEYMPDVMQTLQSLFSAYYLQALAVTTTISNVSVGKILGRLNPNTNPASSALGKISFESIKGEPVYSTEGFSTPWLFAAENYKYKLPSIDYHTQFALESQPGLPNNPIANKKSEDKKKSDKAPPLFDGKTMTPITDTTNLSVGKLLNVTIKENDQSVVVPLSIRLFVTAVPDKNLVSMLTMQNRDTTFKERWHAYRAGKISFVKDLILCQDLIDESKKAMMKDKDGVISQIFQRSNNSKLSALFGDDLNLASASNLYVISEATQAAIEQKLTSKLSNFKTREMLFKSGYMMILVVVDRTWERVTFYHRGIVAGTSVGIKDIKAANKGSGPDIGDILKAYMLGNSPKL